MKKLPKIKVWKKIILCLPILISLSLIFILNRQSQIYMQDNVELLAPVDTTPLLICLIIFTIGYVIFLILMFSEEISGFFKSRW